MTMRKIMQAADQFAILTIVFLIALPLACWLCGRLGAKASNRRGLWKALYTALVYGACFPAIFVTFYASYTSFLTDEDLADIRLFCYALPILTLVVTLVLVRGNKSFPPFPWRSHSPIQVPERPETNKPASIL